MGGIVHITTRRTARTPRPHLAGLVLLALFTSTLGVEANDFARHRAASGSRARNVNRVAVGNISRTLAVSVKASVKQVIRRVGDSAWLAPVVYNGSVRRVLSTLPGSGALYGSAWDRRHPFDREHGTDTSGFIAMESLLTGHPAEKHGSPYAGVQPSVLRAALHALPSVDGFTFIDLGCGKGRPMLVATEFPFRRTIGVELSPLLAEVAAKNARLFAQKYPARPPVAVEQADATTIAMPDGHVVLFIYNSFDRELMQRVVANVEAALLADRGRIFYVIYCNPVSGSCFDASPLLARRCARTIPYAADELGFAEDSDDAVVIWQGGAAPPVTERADAQIVIVKDRWRAALRA